MTIFIYTVPNVTRLPSRLIAWAAHHKCTGQAEAEPEFTGAAQVAGDVRRRIGIADGILFRGGSFGEIDHEIHTALHRMKRHREGA